MKAAIIVVIAAAFFAPGLCLSRAEIYFGTV